MNVAVVGATGLVGKELVSILCEKGDDRPELTLVGSSRSAGERMQVRDEVFDVVDINSSWYRGQDVVYFVTDSEVSRGAIPGLRGQVPIIIDNSSAFRMDLDVPLVVPQVNPDAAFAHHGLIANPNCSTIQLVLAVFPVHQLSPLKKILVSTYQAASGAGKGFLEAFWEKTRIEIEGTPLVLTRDGNSPAFNLLPTIDTILDDGFTREEEKIMRETRKILSADILQVSATAVRVPVANVHCESVYLETEQILDKSEVIEALSGTPGVRFVEGQNQATTPREVSGLNEVFVSRLRRDRDVDRGIHMWVVADNLRKGAALNAVEIADLFEQ